MNKKWIAYFFIAAFTGGIARAEIDYWKVSDLRNVPAGTKGEGLTTFKGDTPEKFNIEVIGMRANGDSQLLLVRLSDKTGKDIIAQANVYHGISGSPVYLDNKLVGAIAYAPDFEKAPLGLVTPFEYMYQENNRRRGIVDRAITEAGKPPTAHIYAEVAGRRMAFTPLTMSDEKMFVADSASTSATAQTFTNKKFCAGCAVSVGIVIGDFTYGGTGTITAVDGDTIYAFGHPMLNAGTVQYPAWRTSILTVFPSVRSSFVFDSSAVGDEATIEYDGNFGIYGTIGTFPEMIPIDVSVASGGVTTSTHCRAAYGATGLEALRGVAVRALANVLELSQDSTVEFHGSIAPRGFSTVNVHEYYGRGAYDGASMAERFFNARYFAHLQTLFASKSDLKIDNLTFSFVITPGLRQTTLEDAWLRTPPEVVACDSLALELLLVERGFNPEAYRYAKTIHIQIPESAKEYLGGIVKITNGNDLTLQNIDDVFAPNTIEDLIRRMNEISVSNNRLYVQVIIMPAKDNTSPVNVLNASSEWERVSAPTVIPGKRPIVFTFAIDVPMKEGVVYADKKFEFRIVSVSTQKKKTAQSEQWLKPLFSNK